VSDADLADAERFAAQHPALAVAVGEPDKLVATDAMFDRDGDATPAERAAYAAWKAAFRAAAEAARALQAAQRREVEARLALADAIAPDTAKV
jgi:hypothetical protein